MAPITRHADYHGIAPSSRETARAAFSNVGQQISTRLPGREQPLGRTEDPHRADGHAAAIDDRRGVGDLTRNQLPDVRRPALRSYAGQLSLEPGRIGDRRVGVGLESVRRERRRDVGVVREQHLAQRRRVCGQQRAHVERLERVVGPEHVMHDQDLPSCSVPIRTASRVRVASESDQFSARVRSSLPSR